MFEQDKFVSRNEPSGCIKKESHHCPEVYFRNGIL